MDAVGAEAYLVNTGWNGSGKRISIKATRAIIDAILDGSIDHADTTVLPLFNLEIPNAVAGVEGDILDASFLRYLLKSKAIDTVIHFAAQSHVDNSFGNFQKLHFSNITFFFHLNVMKFNVHS